MFKTLLIAVLFAYSGLALAFDPFKVRDIRVEGIQRIEPGTVFSYLPVKPGDLMTDDKAQTAIRALFGTGFFRDVRLEVQGDVLVVVLEERPAIAAINFSGMKDFQPDAVKKSLKEVNIQEGRIFDRSLLDQAEQEIKRQYLSRGKYGVAITTTVTPQDRNRVAINFAVDEGEVAKIASINITGNRVFDEKQLLELFSLRTPGWLTWYTKNDQYSRQKLQGDIETMRSFYLNSGYADFAVESTQVSITPDKREIYITINVVEGEKYTVTGVTLAGDTLVPKAELEKLVTIRSGEPFSREHVNETVKRISDRLGNDGYAFANANAVPEINREKRTVAFSIFVDPGRRVYVRRINIAGNTKTRDEVIRREMRQLEGAFYDAGKVSLSKQRVDRTQYFSEVEVETPAVPGTSDQVDVNLKVVEKPTGSLMFGLGFSNVDKLVIQGQISQANIFGSGKTLSAQVNRGRVNKVLSFGYYDPYFTVDGVGVGFDAYNREVDATVLNIGNYKTRTVGAGGTIGIPLNETDGIRFGLSPSHTRLSLNDSSPTSYRTFASTYGSSYASVPVSASWARDTRDSALWTMRGYVRRIGSEVSAIGDLQYYKANIQQTTFIPLSAQTTLSLNGEFAGSHGLGSKPMPFFLNYYAGGVGSVRGYQTSTLGYRDSDGRTLGGTRKLVGNAEVLFPMPGAGKDRSFRLAAFLDGGQVYADGQSIKTSELRYSSGLAVSWNSPFGPLRVSYALPLNNQSEDRIQRFQFILGQTF